MTDRWAEATLDQVLDRVTVVQQAVGDRFPLYADPVTGEWTTSRRGAWTSGFWAGLWWLRVRRFGATSDRATAAACTDRLRGWVTADTAVRGLIFWYGTTLADRSGAELRSAAAQACLESMDPQLGLMLWGTAFDDEGSLVRVDGLPGLVPLLADAGAQEVAVAQVRRYADLCLDERLGVTPAWAFEEGMWVARSDPPYEWSRGRAWLLLAMADSLLFAAEPVPDDVAERLASPALVRQPYVDTSAQAITAVALLKLAQATGRSEYRSAGTAILRGLVEHHVVDGGLRNGCYDAVRGLAVQHELVWGDFFLALGLAALTGVVDLAEI